MELIRGKAVAPSENTNRTDIDDFKSSVLCNGYKPYKLTIMGFYTLSVFQRQI